MVMRLLADENIATGLIDLLRKRGHDVLSAKVEMRAEPDHALLKRARAEQRVLLTHDKDFGELAFRSGLPASGGVVLLRLSNPEEEYHRVCNLIESRPDWEGHFSVVTDDAIRMRKLREFP